MPVDYGILSQFKSVGDYDIERQQRDLQNQVVRAQIKKASQLDVDALGEQAFMKAAMGAPLSPQEMAAAQFVDAKSGGQSFNPVTGEIVQRPRISEKIGLGNALASQPSEMPVSNNFAQAMTSPAIQSGPDYLTEIVGATEQPMNEWDAEYQRQLAAAPNPKVRQEIMSTYAKSKLEMNADQSKNAGFADRMANAGPIVEKTTKAATDPVQRVKAAIPLLGNFIVSGDYQSFNQAQRDFINAQLRRESGAVISPEEFNNAEKQYFPAPGDNEATLAQKAANREAAYKAMVRSAGPAYKEQPKPSAPKLSPRDIEETLFNARKKIQASPASRAAVIKRLEENGISTEGL